MAFQPAVCKNCGGGLQVDDIDLNGFTECPYCNTPHKIIDIITIDGLPTAKTYLMNAERALKNGDIDQAVQFYNRVLEIKPNCHEAFWGLYICQHTIDSYYGYRDKYGNGGPIVKANMLMDALNRYAYKAIEYASEKEKLQYEKMILEDEKYINAAKKGTLDKKHPDLFGNLKSGCYIATCVYGSYDCDEVAQLRCFRDEVLSKYLLGRLFIRFYYTISPFLVKHIKKGSFLEKEIRQILDKIRKMITKNM